jgi:3-oxoacid CoA-transferase A subunit
LNKQYASVAEAVADIPDGAVISIAGFFTAGVPRQLLRGLLKRKIGDLTLACGCGPLVGAGKEMTQLVKNKQIRKVIDSYGLYRSATKGASDPFEQAVRKGEIELEVYPMGTLAEKYRSAGAGIPAFYTPTGVGSVFEKMVVSNIQENRKPKETREIGGRRCVLELALKTDYAFVHAYKGDTEGNLKYRKTAANFNHVMATAGSITIAEVEHLVAPGDIAPDEIDTPGIYVQRVVQTGRREAPISID